MPTKRWTLGPDFRILIATNSVFGSNALISLTDVDGAAVNIGTGRSKVGARCKEARKLRFRKV